MKLSDVLFAISVVFMVLFALWLEILATAYVWNAFRFTESVLFVLGILAVDFFAAALLTLQ